LRPDRQSLPELTLPEIRRYGRHLTLAEVGEEGQKRLKAGRVLVVGAGGLGSPLALYLAAAGVGTIGIVDFDAVEESNLQRQIAHGTAGVGKSKLGSITARLKDLNPNVTVVPHEMYLDRSNALAIVRDYDVIVDGTDNFATRYLVNDACVLERKPNVYGSILRFEGQASVFDARVGPCYRCLFPEPPPPGVVPHEGEADQMTVRDFADRLARGEDLVLVDVREPHELALARFPGAPLHVPLRAVPVRAAELPRERLLVLACHKGIRSQRALEILRELGFTRLKNLAGGIDAWSREVDSSVPRY